MDTVTYPSQIVQGECAAHWLRLRIDVGEREELAAACGVEAIPAAVALDATGSVRGTILGFVEPEPFARQLLQLRPR